MRSKEIYSVTSRQVHDRAAGILRNFLITSDHGYKCTASVLTMVLLYAASRVTSIYDACLRLARAPSSDAVFKALQALLPREQQLARQLNLALACDLPSRMSKRCWEVAIDLTEIPYHGEPLCDPRELRRSKPKGGTTHFHAYATACIVVHGCRYTLAVTPVWRNEPMHEVLRRLMPEIRRCGVKIRYLLLDRAFYNLDVVSYLQNARYPFVMPVVHRGRRAKDPAKATGTQRFLVWKRSGFDEHVMRNKGRKRTVRIAVSYIAKHGKARKPRVWVYAFWKIRPPSVTWLREKYRKRFGIETSYRQMNQARIRTCTRDPLLRLLFLGVALILRNLWVWFHQVVLSRRICGKLCLHLERLRVRAMLLHLQRFIEAVLESALVLDAQGLLSPPLPNQNPQHNEKRNY
jgi:Transposase DDE domain